MSNRRHIDVPVYSSACRQALEQQYCSSCSAAVGSSACVVSSQGFGARLISRVYYGGRQAIYTATVGAMLVNNLAIPAYGETSTVPAGSTVSGVVLSATGEGEIADRLYVYGATVSTVIGNWGIEVIQSDGGATSATIMSGGSQIISGGGVVSHTLLNEGGYQEIQSGGIAYYTSLYDNADQHVSDGGSAVSNVMMSGGTQYVSSGAYVSGGTLSDGGSQVVWGTTSDMKILSGGEQTISSGGKDYAATVSDGGKQIVSNGGMASGTLVADGTQHVSSGATMAGTLALQGGEWDQGAYTYNLFQDSGSDKDYYLRSTGQYTPVFETMVNIPAINVQIARAGMNSLQKRLGDLQDMDNLLKKQGVWTRGYLKDMTVKEMTKTDVDLAGVEAGYDWLFFPDNEMRLYAGLMAGYIDVNSVRTRNRQDSYSKGDGYAPSVGLYGTLVNSDRWFLDFAVRDFWTSLHMKQYTTSRILEYKPKRNVLATSLEGGKSFLIPVERNAWVNITPKLELYYMYAFASKTDVKQGTTDLEYKNTPYLGGKLGLQVGYKTFWLDGLFIEPFAELGYGYEWKGRNRILYDGVWESTSAKGGLFEADLGLNMQLGRNWYWYLLGSYERGPKLKAWGGHVGIRYMFGKHSDWRNQQTAIHAAQARAEGFTKNMVQQNKTTTYVDAPSENRAGETYQRPLNTDQYVYPAKPLPAYGQHAVQPVYQVRDGEGQVEMNVRQTAGVALYPTQAEINRMQAARDIEVREREAAREEAAQVKQAAKDRQEFIDEFIGEVKDIDAIMVGDGTRSGQKPARVMWEEGE